MDQILSKVWNSRYGKYLLPLSFCVGNLINVMFYYLGLAFQDNIARQTGFVIVDSSCRSVSLFFISRILHRRLRRSKAAGVLVL